TIAKNDVFVTNLTENSEFVTKLVENINLDKLVKTNETLTVLSYDQSKNALTYEDENDISHVIDLGTGKMSYDKVTNTITYVDAKDVSTVLTLNKTSLTYNEADQKLVYVDSEGKTQTVDLSKLVKANETLTVLSYDQSKNALTYEDENNISHVIDLGTGVMSYDKAANTITYVDAKGDSTTLTLNKTSLTYNEADQKLVYVDSEGKIQTVDLSKLVKANETVTKLVDNKNGTYTYYNEEAFDKQGNEIESKGVTFTLPTYNSYIITAIEDYDNSKKIVKHYNYNDIVYAKVEDSNSVYSPNPNLNFTSPPLYQVDFNVNKNEASTKFIQLSAIVRTKLTSINNVVLARGIYSNYRVEISINNKKVYSFVYLLDYIGGASLVQLINVNKVISLANVSLNSSGVNSLTINLIPANNLFYANRGVGAGQFLEGSNRLLTLSVDDISFQLFEK
ncbi:hypothetical protein HX025_17365, partial [Myroides odoratimimus]|nr:hypothetical protein [Myroides odoratimimus]